jgi:hypothetical protein
MSHADAGIAVSQLENEVVSVMFRECARQKSGSKRPRIARMPRIRSLFIRAIREIRGAPLLVAVADLRPRMDESSRIKNPHDEPEQAGFQLENEVVSARFSHFAFI